MNIATHPRYQTALITALDILPVALLKKRTNILRSRLQDEDCLPGATVLLYISDRTWLLPAVWASAFHSCNIVPCDVDSVETPLSELVSMHNAAIVLTEKKYSIDTCNKGWIQVDAVQVAPANDREIDSEEAAPQLRITGSGTDEVTVSNYIALLDRLYGESNGSAVLITKGIPFLQQLLAMMWCSSKGIPVVNASQEEVPDLLKKNASPDCFPMEFGLFHFGSYTADIPGNKYSQLFDTVRFADSNGFTAVWTPERHFNQFGGLFPNPSVISAALAVATSNVQIRCGSIVSPLHHPVRIAEDWALIDNLSGGRAAVSFASGWQCDDFVFMPDNYANRHQCMMDQISTVKKLWKGEKMPFKNGLGNEVPVSIYPRPVQQEIPVWITVSNRTETFIDAGKVGANILTHLLWQDTDELIGKIAEYRKSLEENGYDPRSRKVSLMVHTYLGADNETVKNKVREPLKNYIRSSTQLIQAMARSNALAANSREVGGRYGSISNEVPAHLMDELVEIAFNRFFEEAALLGTVDKAARLLRKLKTYDVDEIASLIDFGLSGDDIMEGLSWLRELKDRYDGAQQLLSPVTLVCCTATELKSIFATNQLQAPHLKQVLLSNANEDVHPMAGLSTASIYYLQEEQEAGVLRFNMGQLETAGAANLFTAAVSSDFD